MHENVDQPTAWTLSLCPLPLTRVVPVAVAFLFALEITNKTTHKSQDRPRPIAAILRLGGPSMKSDPACHVVEAIPAVLPSRAQVQGVEFRVSDLQFRI